MIFSDPRKGSGYWRYLCDIHLLCTNKPLRLDVMDSTFRVKPRLDGAESWVRQVVYNGQEYSIGARYDYQTRDSKMVTYNLGMKEELIDVSKNTITGVNYSIYVDTPTPLHVRVNDRIFPLTSPDTDN
jgi:hypothetical protein